MKNLLFLFLFLPFIVKAQVMPINTKYWVNPDTVKIVMLISDTSTVKNKPGYQDTKPFMAYGYQTSKGEILDAYKKNLNKNIVLWIAYRTK